MRERASQYKFVLIAAVMLVGCSSFNRDWKRMAEAGAPQTGMEGRWDGGWQSDATGHSNRLRCIISKKEDNLYLARFHANFKALFKFTVGYTVPLKVEQRDDKFHFEGEANLHWYAGGLYHYQGTA